jgi:general nucleoside transport system permease protein
VNDSAIVTLVVSGIAFGTPIVLATVGEILVERGGVLNLGIEGMMLVGAVSGFWLTQQSENALLGLAMGTAMGALLGLIFAGAAVSLRVNQVVLGLAFWIFGIGLSAYIGESGDPALAGQRARATLQPVFGEGLRDLPVVGPVLFGHDVMVYLSWVLVAVASFYLFRTRAGLVLRAVGDDPASADAMGIDVTRVRYAHTAIGGAGAGLAGAYISVELIPSWVEGLTSGLGWIAIALVVVAGWRPWRALVGAYVFGALSRLGFTLQVAGVKLPTELLAAIPYVFAIVALVLVSRSIRRQRTESPVYLAQPYVREELT